MKKTSAVPAVVPAHIAFICDGNRRWAKMRGMPSMEGHREGAKSVDKTVEHLLALGVSTMSFFVFSTDNWGREKREVDFLINFVLTEMPKRKKMAMEKNVRIKFIGRRNVLPPKIIKMCEKLEYETSENTAGTICFAFDYSGTDEIVRAARAAIESGIAPDALDRETFETFLDSGELPPIDLVVRTSGESRISDFMLWKLAYAELSFVSDLWPSMNPKILDRVLADYGKRKRRFGK
ncbi:MAG: polyprenyl diphosphate synthase [Alphaproteobacteria bacterium]|nr:polyprenyl diphosphate synthase [Alphaproteobacteria bacterium]